MSTSLSVSQYGIPRKLGGRPLGPLFPSLLSEFDAGSAFTRKLSPTETLDSASAATVAKLNAQVNLGAIFPSADANGVQAWYGQGYFITFDTNNSVPTCYVPPGQATHVVTYVNGSGVPQGGLLQSLLNAVPIPMDLAPSALLEDGPDKSLTIYERGISYHDGWLFNLVSGAWQCQYGYGSTIPVTGVCPNNLGCSASGTAISSGQLTIADWLAGVARHALSMALPITTDTHVLPLTRHDTATAVQAGGTYAAANYAIPEGTKFRLPASFDVAAYVAAADVSAVPSALQSGWKRLLSISCTAIRDYGFMVIDSTGGVMGVAVETPKLIGTQYHPLRPEEVPAIWGAQHVFWDSGNLGLALPWSSMQVVQAVAAT